MDAPESEELIKLLAEHQEVLFYYIRTLVHDVDAAGDILQETNMILWKKMNEFETGTSFLGWSRKVAHFQVLAWCRDRKRENILFNNDMVSLLAQSTESRSDNYLEIRQSLKKCLALLPEHGRQIIQKIYGQGMSVSELAKEQDRTPNAISQSLFRIRTLLKNCMNSKPEN